MARTLLLIVVNVVAFIAIPWLGAILGLLIRRFLRSASIAANFLVGFLGYFAAVWLTSVCFRWLSAKPHWLLFVGLLVKCVVGSRERMRILQATRMPTAPEAAAITGDVLAILSGWLWFSA
jgi:hypothetical protein